jgi:hypothetical protein
LKRPAFGSAFLFWAAGMAAIPNRHASEGWHLSRAPDQRDPSLRWGDDVTGWLRFTAFPFE